VTHYSVIVAIEKEAEDEGYAAYSPTLPGCFSNGKTVEEAKRNIRDAIQKLTPFFHLDEDPYMVTTSKGLFWIQDAYTVSSLYPNAQPFEGKFNYIRNAVKIVVDAYNGSIDYYIATKDDPIIRTYNKIYPNLLKPLDKMDSELAQHIR